MADIFHRRSVRPFLSLCLGITSLTISAPCRGQGQTIPEQIAQHEQSLANARATKRSRDEASELNSLGSLYRQAGKTQKALDDLNLAISIERGAHIRGGEAKSLDEIGRIYTDLGQEQKALEFLNQALPIWRETSNRRGEALTLENTGRVYSDLGQEDQALNFLNQALPIWRETGQRRGEASCLNAIGRVYFDMSRWKEALDSFNQALPIWREVGDRSGEALTLNNFGRVYSALGQEQKTLNYYNQALVIWREVGNRQGEARTLHDIGKVYSDIGALPKALDFYNQSLPVWREVGNRSGEALTLTDIGRVYSGQGESQKALDSYNQALPIWHQVENKRGEAYVLSSIGRANSKLGQPQKALPQKLAALALAQAAGDPDLVGSIETSLMVDFRTQNCLEEAIFFGKNAVNSFQQIRKNISSLDKDLQIRFAESKSTTYRELAEVLVQDDRLAEAEQVLDLLKEQELKEVVRGAAADSASKVEPLKLSPSQQNAQSELAAPEKTAEAVTALSLEYGALLAKDKRTPEEESRLKILDKNIEQANSEVTSFFTKTLYPQLSQNAGTQEANALLSKEKSEVSRLQNTLADLGPRVIGIRLLLGEEHAYAIVVTAHSREKFELKATPAELRSKVLQVRDDLRSPSSDPKHHLAELYAIVVAPFAEDLKALEKNSTASNRVPTLLWSLDGVLRYLPMAALYDGQHYLLERFNNVLFTPESYGHMAPAANPSSIKLRVLAMGLSKSYGGLPALPGVMPELEAVVRDPAVPESHGPMDGRLLPNEQFTLAALKTELGAGKNFPVVHIASHFVEETGDGEEPYLMLGGETSGDDKGYELTLSKMEDSSITFHGTELLTLSACSTAKGDAAKDGQEMDSLGMIAQQKDAGAVLASLWDVNDASTSQLMSDFYSRWVKTPADGKAEALRQAQLAFLRASTSGAPSAANDRGLQVAKNSQPSSTAAGYSHPFFWAPFILIGNYQ